jgi:hypothetical protein
MPEHASDNLLEPSHGERCLPEECRAACCPGGIWVDILHVQRILGVADAIRPYLSAEYRDNEDMWFGDEELDHDDFPSGLAIPTAIVPRPGDPERTGCVFLRTDHRCGLQVASEALGAGWPGLKPRDCAMYPITCSDGTVHYDEETTAANPHADCQRQRPTPPRPRYVVFRQEVELAIGRAGWQRLDARARGEMPEDGDPTP